MANIQHVIDDPSAMALADMLNGSSRRRPVVVVTSPSDRAEPWIDVEHIAQEAGNLADVFLLPTGARTWAFSKRMAEGTQVYGGAGRVYPVGHEWAADLSKSPLRFAFDADDGKRATLEIVSDMFKMAAAAGLLQLQSTQNLRLVRGVVQLLVAGRALVDVGIRMQATIAEELTAQDIPIQRLVRTGQNVEGWYDADTRRIDVTKSLRSADDALAAYAVGDVVLTKVAAVRKGRAELIVYPRTTSPVVTVTVLRDDVTTNPLDDLRTLMTVGEVIPARVVARAPQWALVLKEVDDDEPIAMAPSLLAGGPPWLAEESVDSEDAGESPQNFTTLPMPRPTPNSSAEARTIAAPAPSTGVRPSPAPSTGVRSSPAPSTGVRSSPPVPNPATIQKVRPIQASGLDQMQSSPVDQPSTTKAMLLKVDGLNAEVGRLKRDHESLTAQLRSSADERKQLRYLLDQAEHAASKAEHDLKVARARLRKASKVKSTPSDVHVPRFADPEQGFRYLVLTCWASRTLPSEQVHRPLPEYFVGPRFLDTLHRLEGIREEKVADVVFEILTGLASRSRSREVHRLRAGPGGDDPVQVRDDGAVCWRASLQVKTPAARRIHYWVLPSGSFELSRVATHDDFEP